MLNALIFDVDGTLAETERDGHRVAFNKAFAEFGLGWNWNDALYKDLLQVTGGRERLIHYWRDYAPEEFGSDDEAHSAITQLHLAKNRFYQEIIASGSVTFRDGVGSLIEEAHSAGLALAVATTTIPDNVAALLNVNIGPHWRDIFSVVVAGNQVPNKKPAPDVYIEALRQLNLKGCECVAIEDSTVGLNAALQSDIPCVVTRCVYTQTDPMNGALACVSGLGSSASQAYGLAPDGDWQGVVDLAQLRQWHARSSP